MEPEFSLFSVCYTNFVMSPITFTTAIEDPLITGQVYYRIKAGICYINCRITTKEYNPWDCAILFRGLPKTAVGQSSYCSTGKGIVGIGVVYIDNNSTILKANLSGQNGNGYTSFSYPIAE